MFNVKILGNSSATPAFGRFPSCQVVNYNDRYYLIDCGEGAQMQLQKFRIKFPRIDGIFISHLHGDHILGLPGLLSSFSIFERNSPLILVGPAALMDILSLIFKHSDTYLKYEIEFRALEDFEPGSEVFGTDRLSVSNIMLRHRTFTRGFVFREKNKRRKFNFFKAKELEIPRDYFHLLKQENTITLPDGRIITPDDVLHPREVPLGYAYCSDTKFFPELSDSIRGVDLLYHEATFMEDLRNRADETHHSTAKDAGKTAALAEVKKLIIGHFSARYKDLEGLLSEAQSEFPETELALEGRVYEVKQNVQ